MSSSKTKWNSLGDFLKEKEQREKEALAESKPPTTESQTKEPSPTIPNHPQPSPSGMVSPAPLRDFNRRANSIEREALPQGLFPGSSKKLWDAIYFRTRGAVQPVMEVQATKRDLMQWSGIKNIKTIEAHVRYFLTTGMMTRQGDNGDPTGYRYGIIMLEEIPIPTPTSPNHPGDGSTLPNPNQKTVMGGDQKMVMVGEGYLVDNKGTSEFPKTFFKTNTERDDDEAFAELCEILRQSSKEVTGKDPSQADAARWAEVASILVAELKIAAARTTVSSVPSFLAEHLRRRLWKVDKRQARAEGTELPDETLKTTSSADASKCPDCAGSGWWYPEGMEKGVKKCAHEKLKTPEKSD